MVILLTIYLFRKYWKIYNVYIFIEKMLQELIKMETKLQKNISYILKFIDCTRFMASLASNLVNNLYGDIYRIKCKLGHNH